ncbi:serine hydrolase [Deinococcus sonorensis]|uniref:Serine hydrolase n=2 Tax=Deinococcus sonorensis TaxID=309891 RepID=A0AAU7U963_9DEIO
MRLLPPRLLRRKGRYVLLAAALALGWSLRPHPASPPTDQAAVPPVRCAGAPPTAAAPAAPSRLSGRLGLYVAVIDPLTLKPLRAVAQAPDQVFPLASSYKQAVLWALLKQVDAGQVKLSERFDVTTANQSLGNYPHDHSDVRTLAGRMIHNSDNTATDILHRRAGLASVQAIPERLNLCHTRLILPTKTWWTAQAGLSPRFPGPATFARLRGPDLLQAAEKMDQDAQQLRSDRLQLRLDDYFDHRYAPETDLGTQNVSTPYEFAQLIAQEFLRPGLSAQGAALQREVMATGFGRSRLRAPIRYFGGKGGNGWRLLTYTGYFETPTGEHVVYTFMQHGADQSYTMHNTAAAFAWINAAVAEVLKAGDEGHRPGPAVLASRR